MILAEIVRALNSINDKVDVVAKSITPLQEQVKGALANCAFDKDLITVLMQTSAREIENMEAEAYAKYIEGMTALASKRGNREAQEFSAALRKLEKKVPESFMFDLQAKHKELDMWKEKVESNMKEAREAQLSLRDHLKEFKTFSIQYDKRMQNAANIASLAMQKSTRSVKNRVDKALNAQSHQIDSMAKELHDETISAVVRSKSVMRAEVERAKTELKEVEKALVEKRSVLEQLAKRAGDNIIEAERGIAQISNTLPRNQRGRRNNK